LVAVFALYPRIGASFCALLNEPAAGSFHPIPDTIDRRATGPPADP